MGYINQIGIPGLIIIVVAALIIFGPKKLPELGSSIGRMIKEFKKSVSDMTSSEEKEDPEKKDKE